MHSPIKRKVLQLKINAKKNKARFSRLLRHPAWKRSGSILKRKSEEKRISGEAHDVNKTQKIEIKGALHPGARTGPLHDYTGTVLDRFAYESAKAQKRTCDVA